MIDVPGLISQGDDHASDALTVGQGMPVEILDIDLVRERVPLSPKAARDVCDQSSAQESHASRSTGSVG
ncbi:hypothetical protein ABZ401_01465 [Streptomyces sp. NPDC005892]|uniref:hypothetical protein n=1 Tax=Streptomyces sp. NPDC005892 TaxID=3155593 RepID=UPI0033CE5427